MRRNTTVWVIAKHALSNLLGELEDVRFLECQNCIKGMANEFSIQYDLEIAEYPEDMVIGSISA
jgi:hypothetical protein